MLPTKEYLTRPPVIKQPFLTFRLSSNHATRKSWTAIYCKGGLCVNVWIPRPARFALRCVALLPGLLTPAEAAAAAANPVSSAGAPLMCLEPSRSYEISLPRCLLPFLPPNKKAETPPHSCCRPSPHHNGEVPQVPLCRTNPPPPPLPALSMHKSFQSERNVDFIFLTLSWVHCYLSFRYKSCLKWMYLFKLRSLSLYLHYSWILLCIFKRIDKSPCSPICSPLFHFFSRVLCTRNLLPTLQVKWNYKVPVQTRALEFVAILGNFHFSPWIFTFYFFRHSRSVQYFRFDRQVPRSISAGWMCNNIGSNVPDTWSCRILAGSSGLDSWETLLESLLLCPW